MGSSNAGIEACEGSGEAAGCGCQACHSCPLERRPASPDNVDANRVAGDRQQSDPGFQKQHSVPRGGAEKHDAGESDENERRGLDIEIDRPVNGCDVVALAVATDRMFDDGLRRDTADPGAQRQHVNQQPTGHTAASCECETRLTKKRGPMRPALEIWTATSGRVCSLLDDGGDDACADQERGVPRSVVASSIIR